MPKKRYIVGLDPGTLVVGWAVLEDELDTGRGLQLLDHGVIRPQGEKHFRLYWVHEKLSELFRKLADRRLDVALERCFVHKNPATAIVLGEARGAVLAAVGEVKGARVFDYSPGEMKKAVAGHGMAQKYQVQLAVKLLLKIDPEEEIPLDASDAMGLGVYHATRNERGVR